MDEKAIRFMHRSCFGKVRYRSQAKAKRAALTVRQVFGYRLYPYPCTVCQGTHLTKLEQK